MEDGLCDVDGCMSLRGHYVCQKVNLLCVEDGPCRRRFYRSLRGHYDYEENLLGLCVEDGVCRTWAHVYMGGPL